MVIIVLLAVITALPVGTMAAAALFEAGVASMLQLLAMEAVVILVLGVVMVWLLSVRVTVIGHGVVATLLLRRAVTNLQVLIVLFVPATLKVYRYYWIYA